MSEIEFNTILEMLRIQSFENECIEFTVEKYSYDFV